MREVVAAADMVEVVSGRTSLRKAGARYSGRCPFHEERTPSFSVNPADKLYHCFGCGKGGDVITFVRETENLDFAGAVEWLAERFRVNLEYEETSPQIEESRKRRDRLHARARTGGVLLRAPPLGDGGGGAGARVPREPRARRGGLPRVPARPLARRTGLRRRRSRRGSRATSCAAPADERARLRLLPAAADVSARRRARARRRLPGAEAPRGRPAEGQVRQLARGRALPQVRDPVRAEPRADGDREAGARGRRRGEHGRDRAAPGRVRARRRLDGHRADRAAAEGAAASDARGSISASTPTRPGRRRRCAAWSSPRRSGSTSGSSRSRRGRILQTRPTASRSGWSAPRATWSTVSGWSSTACPTARRRLCGRARSCSATRTRPSGRTRSGCSPGRLDLPKETLAGLTPKGGVRTLTQELSPKMLGIAERLERDVLAACVAHPALLQLLEEISPEHFELGDCTAASASSCSRR